MVENSAATSSTNTGGDGPPPEVKLYEKKEVEKLVTGSFNTFLQERCGECNGRATKKYKGTMAFVVSSMVESFWCPDCGRILCEKHRYQHKCERIDAEAERRKKMTKEDILEELERGKSDLARKEAIEEARKDEERIAKQLQADAIAERKRRRLILAQKSKTLEDWLQQFTRDENNLRSLPPGGKNKLFDGYEKLRRISLQLYNEYEHPSLGDKLDDNTYNEAKDIFNTVKEVTQLQIMVRNPDTGGPMPLVMENPWDNPENPTTAAADQLQAAARAAAEANNWGNGQRLGNN